MINRKTAGAGRPSIPNPRIDFSHCLSTEQTEALIRAGLKSLGCLIPDGATVQWHPLGHRHPVTGATKMGNPSMVIDIIMAPETAGQFRPPAYPAAPVVDDLEAEEEGED